MASEILNDDDNLLNIDSGGGGGGDGGADVIKNFDIGMDGNPDNMKLPSLEEVMSFIENIKDLSDEDRENLKRNLIQQQAEATEKLSQYAATQQNQTAAVTAHDYLIFAAMVGLIITVFVLFGYKLYKSLMEKQRKREEKLKAKQSKKKK